MSAEAVPAGRHLSPAVVVRLPAEIDIVNSAEVGERLRAALAPGVRLVIADMRVTTFCDNSGMRQLRLAHRAAAVSDTPLCLAGCGPIVTRLLNLTGLAGLIPVHSSVRDALTAFDLPIDTEHEPLGGPAA